MERLTHERVNGIKTGYWSAATKEVLVQKLAVHIDLTQVNVDVHGLARGGDDALDDGLRVKGLLARDDDIADLIVAAEQRVDDEKPVAVLQRRDR